MTALLYSHDILRLAMETGHLRALSDPDGSAERRSAICGSRVRAEVKLAPDGKIAEVGFDLNACALGQASTTLLARRAVGLLIAEVSAAEQALRDYLSGLADNAGAIPGEIFAEARSRPARHGAILLPYEALRAAMKDTAHYG